MKKIELTQGYFTLVDDEDFDDLNKYSWRISREQLPHYARHSKYVGLGKPIKSFLMHRMIMKAPKGIEVDHIDGNGLNNQKNNLRLATRAQNACNIKKVYGEIPYRGVYRTIYNTFRATISYKGKKSGIGTYKTAIEAAKAYDKVAIKLFKEFAQPNFP